MKTPNNLSRIYFRHKTEDGEWENWCFEDLPFDEQEKYLKNRSETWLKSMILKLASTLKKVGDEFEIKSE